jgi:cytochrome oxidase Cu insertion factor (SCO1/SenC/PrrC family)
LTAIGIIALSALEDRLRRAVRVNLPVLGAVPDFALTDRDGRPVTRSDLAGAPWVADLVFTRCTLACPAMSQRMRRLDRDLPEGVRLVSVTVDPDHDTPARLAAYAAALAASGRWLFLTGDREAIRHLAREGFKLAVDRVPAVDAPTPGEAIVHSDRFVLVDAQGRIRGYFSPLEPGELGKIERAVAALQEETATR